LLILVASGGLMPRPLAQAAPDRGLLTSRARPARPAVQALPVGEQVYTQAGERRRMRLGEDGVIYLNEQAKVKRRGPWQLQVEGEVYVELERQSAHALAVQTPRREVKVHPGGRVDIQAGKDGTGVVVAGGEAEVQGADKVVRAGQMVAATESRLAPAPRASFALAWARDLMTQGEPRLVPASEYSGGRLVARDPDGGQAGLGLRRYHVDVHVEGGFARTVIDQTYFNDSNDRLEGTFYFPLPADASLSQLVMYVEGQRRDGAVVERERARAVYEQIIYQQRDPALLEWVDGSTFKMRVFPLEPRQEKRIILGYTQKMPSLYGQAGYRFPAGHTLHKVRDWSFHLRVKDGARMTWTSPGQRSLRETKEGPDLVLDAAARDVALDGEDVSINLIGSDAGKDATHMAAVEHDGAKYLLVSTRPELPPLAEPKRRDWVFLFESSGDRDPLLARAQVEIVRGLLDSAGPDDTFVVLTANTRVRAFAERPQTVSEESVRAAVTFLEGSHLIGALDLGNALTEAGKYLRSAKAPYFVHVGSGIAAMGERRNEELAKRLPASTPYVGIGVGRRWNRALMKAAAERSAGYFTQINPDEGISWRTFELAATLNTPRLLDVSVADPDDKASFLPLTRLAAHGEEITAIARMDRDASLPQKVLLRGQVNGRPFEREVAVRDVALRAGYLPREWARLEIERLLAEDARKHRERIIELSKAMTLVTPFTSLLVLESDEMEKQFKVEHGRREQWAAYACPERIEVVYEPEDGPPGDPKKGIKPAPRQVARTILARQPAEVLERTGAMREEYSDLDNHDVGMERLAKKRHDDTWGHLPERSRFSEREVVELKRLVRQQHKLSEGKAEKQLEPTEEKLKEAMLEPAEEKLKEAMNVQDDERDEPSLTQLDLAMPPPARAATPSVMTEGEELRKHLTPLLAVDSRLVRRLDPARREELAEVLLRDDSGDSLLYQRPNYRGDERIFFDLVAYAPGMDTSIADRLAVLEAEAAPSARNKRGAIDEGARNLFQRARSASWRSYTQPAEGQRSGFTIHFDGQGRYAWERTLFAGLRERVVCDGKTLWHLYPDLGLGAQRQVSRFHRLELASLVPWALPAPEDLARGASLRCVGKDRMDLVPAGAGDKNKPYLKLVFVFGEDGHLAEQQLVQMPEGKVLRRKVCMADGTIRVVDGDNQEQDAVKGSLRKLESAPSLAPDTRRLVVLPLPYRSREHVVEARKLEKTDWGRLSFEDGRALLASLFAAGDVSAATDLCQRCFFQREQYDLGLYVLLAACGQNLDGEHVDVLAHHAGEPLAQYLALYSSPVLRKHASQWAVRSSPWAGFLRRLATAHALLQRWESGRPATLTEAQQQADLQQALKYIRENPADALGFALLSRMQDRLREDEGRQQNTRAAYRDLAKAWQHFEESAALREVACYEQARCLFRGGEPDGARKRFLDYYHRILAREQLPRIDGDFRTALLDGPDQTWRTLMTDTTRKLIRQKRRQDVLTLALQCWQLDDPLLSDHLLSQALEGAPKKEEATVRLGALRLLWQSGQLIRAEQTLQALLNDKEIKDRAGLWRLAARLAERRGMPARQLECLERALDAEHEHLPDVINLRRVRRDYGQLLQHYQTLAHSLEALRMKTPADFQARVVRTADRWRALDRDNAEPCRLAARTLRALGDRELMWDYLTTPVGMQPAESEPWKALAVALHGQGEVTLADRAYQAACEAAPTDAGLLWERAQGLRQAGRIEEARRLYRQLAEGDWQPRFQALQQQAKAELR
jgi:Flp pilus assembly protein TadD